MKVKQESYYFVETLLIIFFHFLFNPSSSNLLVKTKLRLIKIGSAVVPI